jgi:hypothetical protein
VPSSANPGTGRNWLSEWLEVSIGVPGPAV